MSLPTFPAEIWHAILRLSVEIPRSLDTKWNYSPDILPWDKWGRSYYFISGIGFHPEYFSALKTKISITQVSRVWREIGVELLYEYLLFADRNSNKSTVFQSMEMVAAIFERHANESGYGRATKRIDAPIGALPVLMRLLNFCHNLRVFVIYRDRRYRGCCSGTALSDLASLLQTRFRHSLRRMSFGIGNGNMFQDSRPLNYHIHLPNLPLDSLDLGSDSLSPYPPPAAITTVSALTIKLPNILLQGSIASWHCPALRHLTLGPMSVECVKSHLSFLITHGPQLISLAVSFFPGDKEFQRLSRLITPATNLRSVVFDLEVADELSEEDIFPSITHIGIRFVTGAHRQLITPQSFVATFPKLQCLRVLGVRDRTPEWLLDIARIFKHIRVENRDCQPIL